MNYLRIKRGRDMRRQRWQFLAVLVTIVLGVMLFAASFDAYRALQGPVFVIRARLGDTAIRSGNRSWPLAPGTSFEADVVRGRWPLYRWLLRSVAGESVRA